MSGRENAGDDWRMGDLAECLTSDWKLCSGAKPNSAGHPQKGERLIVSAVIIFTIYPTKMQAVTLQFVGKTKALSWGAEGFRKIIGDHEEPKRVERAPEPVA
jgi:hypothetical protein